MSMPKDNKQLRSLLGGLSSYRKLFPSLTNQVRPLNFLREEGEKFEFPPKMENTVRVLLAKILAEPVLD